MNIDIILDVWEIFELKMLIKTKLEAKNVIWKKEFNVQWGFFFEINFWR